MRLIDADALPLGRVEWEDIVNAPTIDAEPIRHGRWKYEYTLGMNYCGECGWGMLKGERRTYDYCPNCGAKMDGGE